jgi:hypothetical protein
MGSSNRACSVSSLSLGGGTPVAFFLLHPHKQYGEKTGEDPIVYPTSHFFYVNCLFDPLCLPIFGEYDDYGGVENIEEDTNSKAIEEFFGLPLADIITCVVGGESAGNTYSAAYRPEGEHQALFGWNVGRHEFNAEWLKKLGFVESPHPRLEAFAAKTDKKYFQFGDLPYWVEVTTHHIEFAGIQKDNLGELITRDEPAFAIWDEALTEVGNGNRSNLLEEFVEVFRRITGYNINVPVEYQEKATLLANLSGMFVHRNIYNALVNSPAERYGKDPAVSDNRVTEELLLEYGFKHVPEEEQISIDPHHGRLYRKEGYPYDVKWGPWGMALVHQRHKEYYVFGDIKQFRPAEVKAKWELMTGTSSEETFPEPVGEVATNLERVAIAKKFTELTGATLSWASQEEDDVNHSIYSLEQFAKTWKKFTNEELDISHHRTKMKHELEFEKVQEKLIEHSKLVPEVYTLHRGTVEAQKESHEREQEFKKCIASLDGKDFEPEPFAPKPEGEEYQRVQDVSWSNPFARWKLSSGGDDFLQYYKDWKYFPGIYRQAFIEGNSDLKQAFVDYRLFEGSMYSCNRFFFPAMNGEQCGNLEESRNLLLASLRVVEQELADRQGYAIEDIAWEAEHCE